MLRKCFHRVFYQDIKGLEKNLIYVLQTVKYCSYVEAILKLTYLKKQSHSKRNNTRTFHNLSSFCPPLFTPSKPVWVSDLGTKQNVFGILG
jgi:hypothetical protein